MSLWKFVIYRSVCKLILENENIPDEGKNYIRKVFPDSIEKRLNRAIPSWISRSFGVNILGYGASFSTETKEISSENWLEQLDILEDLIERYCDNCKYFVMFDALDDDYKMMMDKEQCDTYLSLITGLFKAAKNVRDQFDKFGLNIFPVVFKNP